MAKTCLFNFSRPKVEAKKTKQPQHRCDRNGCHNPGTHRAPKQRRHTGTAENDTDRYYWFCADHIRSYNRSYNYFDGMDARAISDFQHAALIGHRPTWPAGLSAISMLKHRFRAAGNGFADPAEANASHWHSFAEDDDTAKPRQPICARGLAALKNLGLDTDADADIIRRRFRILVKDYHPDLHKNHRDSADIAERLRVTIDAYGTLKSLGLC